MRNVYKDMSIFKCVHEAHSGFENQMSAHHILNKKGCFPHGCFYFKWRCKLMDQGKNCYRGYKHMGRNCNGCRHFLEEKVHNRTELQVSEAAYAEFQEELRDFEEWLEENLHRETEIEGRIDGVKPLFRKRIYRKGEGVSFGGFLLIFRSIFLGMENMEDFVYARVSAKTFNSFTPGRGDLLTARATLEMDNGRLVLRRLRRIRVEERGEPPFWNESRALVARETATHLTHQPEGCQRCPFGALIDVEDQSRQETRHYRHLYCLKGMPHYQVCPDYLELMNRSEPTRGKHAQPASCQTRRVNVNSRLT